MPSYEAMFIFKPDLKEEEQKTLVDKLENVLKENQAKIENKQVFGRRRLAYQINKYEEGLYYLINFSAQMSAVPSKLKHFCNINEDVLRVLIIKRGLKS